MNDKTTTKLFGIIIVILIATFFYIYTNKNSNESDSKNYAEEQTEPTNAREMMEQDKHYDVDVMVMAKQFIEQNTGYEINMRDYDVKPMGKHTDSETGEVYNFLYKIDGEFALKSSGQIVPFNMILGQIDYKDDMWGCLRYETKFDGVVVDQIKKKDE
jgi:hypothetical protein